MVMENGAVRYTGTLSRSAGSWCDLSCQELS